MDTTSPTLIVHEASAAGTPIVCGFPIPSDETRAYLAGATLTYPDGTSVPVQCHPLTPETPAGLRWMEASCLATAKGEGTLSAGGLTVEGAVIVDEIDAGLRIDNGLFVVRVETTGEAPVTIDANSGLAGKVWPELVGDKGIVHREQTPERTVKIVRRGPLRVMAEVSGRLQCHDGTPSFSYRLTVDVWAGTPSLRLDFMLAHTVPGAQTMDVQRATLVGDWAVGADPVHCFQQVNHGVYYKPRVVRNAEPVALIVDHSCGVVHVSDPAMLRDDTQYDHYLQAPTVGTDSWLALAGSEGWLAATVVDFAATRPNQLRSEGNRFSYDLIPQGHGIDWPQGRRKQQSLLFTFGTAELASAGELNSRLAMGNTSGRAQAAPAWLAAVKAFDVESAMPAVKGENVRLSMLLDRLCQLDTPGDKWNLGDTMDPGYTCTYPAVPNRHEWLPGAPRMQLVFDPPGRTMHKSLRTSVEPVWTNNEYDIIHALGNEVMRTGACAHAQMLRWTARHTIEVDFLCFNDNRWHHRATPAHSAHHNTTGAYPSHFWTQGLLQYYALTGDRDAEEVVLALGDKIIECNSVPEARLWGFDRELGWGLLSLVCLCELGYDKYREEAERIAQFLMDFDRSTYRSAVKLSSGKAGRSLERQMIDGAFAFASLIEAMDRFQKLSGREDLSAWLEELLRQLLDEAWNAVDDGEFPGMRSMVPHMMAMGYERTGDIAFLEIGVAILEQFFDTLAMGQEAYFGYVKPNAMLYRSLTRFLGHAHRQNLLAPFEFKALRKRQR